MKMIIIQKASHFPIDACIRHLSKYFFTCHIYNAHRCFYNALEMNCWPLHITLEMFLSINIFSWYVSVEWSKLCKTLNDFRDRPCHIRPSEDPFPRLCVCEEVVEVHLPPCPACPSRPLTSSVEQSSFWVHKEAAPAVLQCRRSSPLHAPTAHLPAKKKDKPWLVET